MTTFQELIEKYGKTIDIEVKQTYSRDDTLVTNVKTYYNEDLRSIKLYYDGALFTSVMRCLDLVFEGDLRRTTLFSSVGNVQQLAKGDYLNLKITVSADNESSSLYYGTFIVAEELEYDEVANTTKVITYDYMLNAMKPYSLSDFDIEISEENPITVENYLRTIALLLGSTRVEGINNLENKDKIITSDPYENVTNEDSVYTFRDVLDDIARSAGCSLAFKSSSSKSDTDILNVIYVTDKNGNMKSPVATLDISNFKSLKIGEKYGAVDSVIFSRQPQNDNVSYTATNGTNNYPVKLKQPEFADSLNDNIRRSWLPSVYNAVKGLEYWCYELESYGILFLNFGDVFNIKTYPQIDRQFDYTQEITYTTVFMRCNAELTGGITESSRLEMPVSTSADNDSYTSGLTAAEKLLRQTYMKVDKKLGIITSAVFDPDTGESKITQTADQINTLVNDIGGLSTQISQLSNEITLKVSSDEAEALISEKADEITLSVVNSVFKGNLLDDSECFATKEFAFYNADNEDSKAQNTGNDTDAPSGKYKYFRLTSTNNFAGVYCYAIIDKSELKAGKTYTLSFYAKKLPAHTAGDFYTPFISSKKNGTEMLEQDSTKLVNPQLKTTWQRYSCTFTVKEELNDVIFFKFYCNSTVGNIIAFRISSIMLNEGREAFDWSVKDEYLKLNDLDNGICSSVSLTAEGLTVRDGKLTISDENGEIMLDSAGIKSQLINFGEIINIECIKNGNVYTLIPKYVNSTLDFIEPHNVDCLSLKTSNNSDNDFGKEAILTALKIPDINSKMSANLDDWYCNSTNSNESNTVYITYFGESGIDIKQSYTIEYDIVLGSITQSNDIISQQIQVSSDKNYRYDVGIEKEKYGTYKINGIDYKYLIGKVKCTIKGSDLIKKAGGISAHATVRVDIISLADSFKSAELLPAILSPNKNFFGFIGNIKMSTFKAATLNSEAILNSNTDYFFNLGTGTIFADDICCNNFRVQEIPLATSKANLEPVYVDTTSGILMKYKGD